MLLSHHPCIEHCAGADVDAIEQLRIAITKPGDFEVAFT
jgi:hypothetical protein